jgi:phosphoadenosine phosphosulfate reductase
MFADAATRPSDDDLVARAAALDLRLADARPQDIIEAAVDAYGGGRLAVVSSFGTEAAVLLDLVAEVDRATPVVFLDTGMLFTETLDYRDTLVSRLGLTDVRTFAPEAHAVQAQDPDGFLWQSAPDACCALRKVAPLDDALSGFDAWLNGRKRYQAATRRHLAVVEPDGTRLKFTPLASWGPDEIKAWFAKRDLPRHPLEDQGFPSIGCMPCTSRVRPGEDIRAGRWRGQGKTECGIHIK